MGSRDDMHSMITTTAEAASKKDEDAVFQGWMATDATSPLKYTSFTPKKWEEEDVDIAVTHCGICAAQPSTLAAWATKSSAPPSALVRALAQASKSVIASASAPRGTRAGKRTANGARATKRTIAHNE
ncbi:MAG: hypothetical protein Q9192_004845 [Flavoplaca navasiana]